MCPYRDELIRINPSLDLFGWIVYVNVQQVLLQVEKFMCASGKLCWSWWLYIETCGFFKLNRVPSPSFFLYRAVYYANTYNCSRVIPAAWKGNKRKLSGVKCKTEPRTVFRIQFGVSRIFEARLSRPRRKDISLFSTVNNNGDICILCTKIVTFLYLSMVTRRLRKSINNKIVISITHKLQRKSHIVWSHEIWNNQIYTAISFPLPVLFRKKKFFIWVIAS